ncbi:TlpA family protein disulfide reductase [Sphingomonas solaris]|uniref:TlpA family protein disulfide reductase n=1 Tax=Alterirhizorhabdus solaris TaxID=2529389 RepID=UPI001EF0AFE6|nr:TlpA family protein disulfide reductase [Sphingomonas solaris]
MSVLAVRSVIALILLASLSACDKQEAKAPQGSVAETNETIGKVDVANAGKPAPAMPFTNPAGGPATLAAYRGKPLLVNLWATWCGPCVREMPTLDALAEREAGRFKTIVVSQDLQGQEVVAPFFAKQKFRALEPFVDTKNVLMTALETDTLPTTIFYDAAGKEQWRVTGGMDWSGERAKTLIEGALNPPGGKG